MKRILVINPFGIGDVIFTLAAVQKMRQAWPGAFIGFVGNERTAGLLRLCPAVNSVLVFNRDELRSLAKKSPLGFLKRTGGMLRKVRREHYDLLVDFSLGREFSLAAAAAGIHERVGFDYQGRGLWLTRKQKLKSYEGMPVAQRQLDLLRETGILPDSRMPEKITIRAPKDIPLPEGMTTCIAVAPGGGRSWGADASYKQWDAGNFAETCNRLAEARPDLGFLLLGDEMEKELLETVKTDIRRAPARVLAGETMEKVVVALKGSRLLLANDGGLAHLANALGVKTVTLFGPVDEKAYGPYGGPAARRVIRANVECRPCYASFHFPPCAHQRCCLTGISVDKVIEAVREIL